MNMCIHWSWGWTYQKANNGFARHQVNGTSSLLAAKNCASAHVFIILLHPYLPSKSSPSVEQIKSRSKANTIEDNRTLLHWILKESNKEKCFSPTKIQNTEKWNFEQKREEITFQWHSFFLAEKFKLRNFLKIEMICIKEENTYD